MTLGRILPPAALLALAIAGCGGSQGGPPPPIVPVARPAGHPSDPCALADTGPVPATLSVGLGGSVDPTHAPLSTTDAERFVFRQLYETLVRLDCNGAPVPELAQSWTSDDGGRRWTFTMRPGARYADGVPVTGADVFAALGGDSLLLEHAAITLEGVDRVSVTMAHAFTTVPPVFADPALAVARRGASSAWLVGTGPVTVDSTGTRLAPSSPGKPSLTMRTSAGGDARDLLDRGVDVLVTRDPAVLSYAAGRGDLATLPLPWDRTYVLLSPVPLAVSDSMRGSLARDVVRIDARPARGPYWWSAGPACQSVVASGPGPTGAARVSVLYYPRDDAPARDLAERLVALGMAGPGGRAAGVAAADLDGMVEEGGASFLLPLARTALEPCHAVRTLVARAPWLSDDPARHIVALIESRPHVIIRLGAAAFTVDWDGTLRLR